MLRWILGVLPRDRKTSEEIRREVEVVNVVHKVCETRLQWYGHVERREENNSTKRIMKAEVY